MKSNSFVQELAVSIVLVIFLTALLDPFGERMPNPLLMMLVVGFALVFALFANFVWRENPRDERESLHRMLAGRAAFLAGSGALAFGIIIQSFTHALDLWLVIALSVMVLAKTIGLIYGKIKH